MPELAQSLGQRLAARRAERIGGMQHRPLLLAKRVGTVVGDHAARIAVVRTEAKQPLVAHMGEVGIGSSDRHRLAEFQNVRRHGVHLRRADRSEKCDDVRLRGQLREGQNHAGVGSLVVFGNQFDLLAENTARLVDGLQRQLAPFSANLPCSPPIR